MLNAGDLLFVPPFWFHRVESVDFCISSSTISPSEEETIFHRAYWKPVPLLPSWTNIKKVISVQLYIHLLLQQLGFNSTDFIQHVLLEMRYLPLSKYLIPQSPMLNQLRETECYRYVKKPDLGEILPKFKKTIDEQVEILKELDVDILTINLANYIEELVGWAVGSENVISFFLYCFSSNVQ